MSENNIGKILYYIGISTIVVGVIGSFICGAAFKTITYDYSYLRGYDIEETYNWGLAIAGSVASFISGVCFIGFSEIISLLRQSVSKQDEILLSMQEQKSCPTEDIMTPDTKMEDIAPD